MYGKTYFGTQRSTFIIDESGSIEKIWPKVKVATHIEEVVDYFFWGGAANTFFWLDKQNDTIGVFATHIMPSLYNVSDKIEQIVDEARSP